MKKKLAHIFTIIVRWILLIAIIWGFVWLLEFIINYLGTLMAELSSIASKMDAVVIVALITGTVFLLRGSY